MKFPKSRFAVWFLASFAILGTFGRFSDAALTLSLDDGNGHSILIQDGGANDDALMDGAVAFVGTLGTWQINISSGALVFDNPATLDLNSLNISGMSGGQLTIKLSQTDFTQSSSGMVAGIGGYLADGGTLTANAYISSSNQLFATSGEESVSFGGFSKGGFSANSSQGGSVNGSTFSMTLETVITHSKAGSTSFDFNVSAVPEPGTMLMWSLLAFPGMCVYLRRRRLGALGR